METDQIPKTIAEENQEHGLLWRWADIRIIIMLQLVGAIIISVQDGGNLVEAIVYLLVFGLGGIIIWLVMILPSLLVRLFYRDRLHWTESTLLTVVGFLLSPP